MNRIKKAILSVFLLMPLMLAGCASHDRTAYDVHDPWEKYNRGVFAFNNTVDEFFLDPLTKVYRFIIPDPFRLAISNFLNNIKSPVYLVNELLQGDLEGAGLVTKRFVFNTFTGFGGIVDTASWEGLTYEPEDFGQTLAVWGVDSGPYMVLPIYGPSNVRDSVGFVVDLLIDPVNWYVWSEDKDDLGYGLTGATILTVKDQVLDLQQELKKSSLDYYAATRSVWSQRRQAVISDGNQIEYEEF